MHGVVRLREDSLARALVAAAFAIGLVVSVAMFWRAQVEHDQWSLLIRGWLFAHDGHWIHYGMRTSAGGNSPGSLTSLLVGLPLMVWVDYRAPIIPILLCHVAAWFLLDRVLRRMFGARERLVFAVLYWLNPWRVYFSGFLWNPNYMFLFGALHFWTSWRLRERPRFLETFLQVAAVGLAFQVHSSAMLLVVVTLLLLARGYIRLNRIGAVCGVLVVLLSLVPWLIEVLGAPRLAPGSEGFVGRGFVLVLPLLRGLGYWIRYGSLATAGRMTRFDFTPVLGVSWDAVLAPLFFFFGRVLAPVTIAVPLVANFRLARKWLARTWRRPVAPVPGRRWLHAYVFASLGSTLICVGVSPSTVMMWQLFPLFHAAVLPVVLWIALLWRTRRREWVRKGVIGFVVLEITLLAAMSIASPMYRLRGRDAVGTKPVQAHPALHELGVDSHCGTVIVSSGGYVADVLRPRKGERWQPSATPERPDTE